MGDRCWAKLTIKAADIAKFNEINDIEISPDEIDNGDGTIEHEYDEINYGGEPLLEDIVNSDKKLTCLFENGHGSQYGPGVTAIFFGYRIGIDTTHGGELFVTLDGQGDPRRGDLEHARYFIKIRNLVMDYFNGKVESYAAGVAALKFVGDPAP